MYLVLSSLVMNKWAEDLYLQHPYRPAHLDKES